MKKLFFDISISGHHSEYISHLVDYIHQNKFAGQEEFYFILNSDFKEKFSSIALKANKCSNLSMLYLTANELKKCEKGNIIKKSFTNYRVMDSYAKKLEVDHVVLLNFNPFQLAFVFFKPLYSVSGILFLQFYRMSKNNWKSKLKYYKKYYLTKFYSQNKSLKEVFILNDDKSVNFLNGEFKTSIFTMLADPIPELSPLKDFNIYDYYGIHKNRKVFLHIGALGDRKGTFEILESAKYISVKEQNEVAILLVGKASEQEAELIGQKVVKASSESAVVVLWDNQFISSQMMKSLFDQCTAVLIPYKNAEASSGILGHATAAGKCVIATKSGLLQEIVNDNKLGILIEKVDSASIARAIEKSRYHQINHQLSKSFVESHTPILFAKNVLSI